MAVLMQKSGAWLSEEDGRWHFTKSPGAPKAGQASSAEEWAEEFVICGSFACKDIPTAAKLCNTDAEIQVKMEPRAPSMAIMGSATAPTGPAPPDSYVKDRVQWLARFECMDAWAGPEHKEREGNKEFTAALFATGMTDDMMGNMTGSYTGVSWHLEKPEFRSESGSVYMVKELTKAKSAEDAAKLVELLKKQGPQELAADNALLRYSLMPTGAVGNVGPLAVDDVTITTIKTWKTMAQYQGKPEPPADIKTQMDALVSEVIVMEFAESMHWAKAKM